MPKFKFLFVVLSSLYLFGCSSYKSVELSPNYWAQKNQKVAVAVADSPKPDFYVKGARGILDAVITNAVVKPFKTHISTLDNKWLDTLANDFKNEINSHGMKAKVLPDTIYESRLPKDKSRISNHAKKLYINSIPGTKGSQLLVLDVFYQGSSRPYYGFVPLGAPKAFCELEGKLIDLKSNRVLWRNRVKVVEAVSGKWDIKPNYPNFDKSFKLAIARASQQLKADFFKRA